VGFDDIHLAQFMLPPLTTVQMSCNDLAAAAVEALRAGIERDHPNAAKTEWQIPTAWWCANPRLSHAEPCRHLSSGRPAHAADPRRSLFRICLGDSLD